MDEVSLQDPVSRPLPQTKAVRPARVHPPVFPAPGRRTGRCRFDRQPFIKRGTLMNKRALAAAFVAALLAGQQAAADALSDANKIFDYAEANYPSYLAPPEPHTFQAMGYIVRYYSDTEVYLGTKDGWVYAYAEAFGGLVNLGSAAYYLNLIDGSGGPPSIDLTGHWSGQGVSLAYPGCTGSIGVDLVQNGSNLTGSGTLTGNCLEGTESGKISGTVTDANLTFGLAYDATGSISYQGQVADNQSAASGRYDWPAEADNGTWSLRRQ
jgi:hypothetical protein